MQGGWAEQLATTPSSCEEHPLFLNQSITCLPAALLLGYRRRLGYRTASTEFNAPLYFLMVHEQVESLI
jgi:hypothetical protein